VGVRFPKVTYAQVAPLVGLEPYNNLKDIKTFDLCRFPTDLFKEIVMDMLMPYGVLPDHRTEEATSRFFSPVRMI
jgi:hypothetical protein